MIAPGGITPDGQYAYHSDAIYRTPAATRVYGVIVDRAQSTLMIPRRIVISPDGTRLIGRSRALRPA